MASGAARRSSGRRRARSTVGSQRPLDVDEHFRVAFENAPTGVAVLTPDGRFARVNRALCELLGLDAKALTQLTLDALTHPEQLARGGAVADEDRRVEQRLVRSDGADLRVALTKELVRDEQGRALFVVLHVEDVSAARPSVRCARPRSGFGERSRTRREFCVLGAPPAGSGAAFVDATVNALAEEGAGFSVTASYGAAVLPEEGATPSAALTIADRRLYAQKHLYQSDRDRPHEVLLHALREREPALEDHCSSVAQLAVRVGARLGIETSALTELRRAAELHDIGKLAMPDGVLASGGRSPRRSGSSCTSTRSSASGRDRSDRPSSSFARVPARSSTPPSSVVCAEVGSLSRAESPLHA